MNTQPTNTELAKKIVVVERHLGAEFELIKQFRTTNEKLADLLGTTDLRDMSQEQLAQLKELSQLADTGWTTIRKKRDHVLQLINGNSEGTPEEISVREFIQSLDMPNRNRLEVLRKKILAEGAEVKVINTSNQVVSYYSYDFHRRLVCGCLQCATESNQYRADGQSLGFRSGNFYKKVC